MRDEELVGSSRRRKNGFGIALKVKEVEIDEEDHEHENDEQMAMFPKQFGKFRMDNRK